MGYGIVPWRVTLICDEPLNHLTTNSQIDPEELLDFLRKEGPFDVVVADFATSSGFQVAEELKIPCILNVPGEGPKENGGRKGKVLWYEKEVGSS